jgi:hypothetical protein
MVLWTAGLLRSQTGMIDHGLFPGLADETLIPACTHELRAVELTCT